MNDASFQLSQDASIQAHIEIARKAIASGEKDLRRAAEHIAQAQEKGAPQRLIALSVGKSAAWVNRLLQWRASGYRDNTPFGPQSKASRARALVQAAERTKKAKKRRRGAEEDEPPAVTRAKAAQAEAAKTKADAERLIDEAIRLKAEAIRLKAEALREQVRADRARAQARASGGTLDARSEHALHSSLRKLLVKALGMLGSDHVGERASAALVAEKQRAKIGMTWDELIVPADERSLNMELFKEAVA